MRCLGSVHRAVDGYPGRSGRAAVAAHRAGAVRRPPVKIGHIDARFDGEPSYGYVDNLRIVDNGQTLVGDLVGLPPMLADLIPVAYADRSIEGVQDFVDASGRAYSFALTGVALLGAAQPGVSTLRSLADVGALYGLAAAARHPAAHHHARRHR